MKQAEAMDKKTIRGFRESLRKFERIVEKMNSDNCCCGVTVPQCHTLMELDDLDDLTINELSEKLCLDKSTVSRTIESLVKSDLVSRVIPAENRRIALISLTPKGRSVCDQINGLNDHSIERVLKEVPEDDLPVFLRSFNIILKNMEKAGTDKSST
jgi:DNA-binding MarR family transcriptional regulator